MQRSVQTGFIRPARGRFRCVAPHTEGNWHQALPNDLAQQPTRRRPCWLSSGVSTNQLQGSTSRRETHALLNSARASRPRLAFGSAHRPRQRARPRSAPQSTALTRPPNASPRSSLGPQTWARTRSTHRTSCADLNESFPIDDSRRSKYSGGQILNPAERDGGASVVDENDVVRQTGVRRLRNAPLLPRTYHASRGSTTPVGLRPGGIPTLTRPVPRTAGAHRAVVYCIWMRLHDGTLGKPRRIRGLETLSSTPLTALANASGSNGNNILSLMPRFQRTRMSSAVSSRLSVTPGTDLRSCEGQKYP